MMRKNDVKLMTEAVMMEDLGRTQASEAAKSATSRIESLSGLSNEADYKAGLVEARNMPELSAVLSNPNSFKEGIVRSLTAGANKHSISMSEAAKSVAIANVIRSAVTTAEPITVFDMYEGARLSSESTDGCTMIDYDAFNIGACKSVSESLDRMIDSVSKSLTEMDINDKPSLLGYGQVLTVLRCL